jgi:hypothetical protein
LRKHLRSEVLRIEGLIAVLMKPRNGVPWSPDDRALLRGEMKRLARATPGFLIFLLPGGVVLLPLYAWFLDTRRARRFLNSGDGLRQ